MYHISPRIVLAEVEQLKQLRVGVLFSGTSQK
jgi:hypothetical protein